MIKASFTYKKDIKAMILKVEGHAGQDVKGKDLVCCAASTLTYTLAQYLHYVNKRGGLQKKPHIDLDEGEGLIIAKPTEECEGEVLNAFFVTEVGYSLLEQNYPQYVELKMFGEAE